MHAADSADATVFSDYLASIGEPFLLLSDSSSEQAHLRFNGRFLGAEVVWDCFFVTLESELQLYKLPSIRCFIEIGPAGKHGVPLRVGLNIARIERADILKMMVMIRNYRRLRRGRLEFGEPYPPARVT